MQEKASRGFLVLRFHNCVFYNRRQPNILDHRVTTIMYDCNVYLQTTPNTNGKQQTTQQGFFTFIINVYFIAQKT